MLIFISLKRENWFAISLMLIAIVMVSFPVWDLIFLRQTVDSGSLNRTWFWYYQQVLRGTDFGLYYYFIIVVIFGYGFGTSLTNPEQRIDDKENSVKMTIFEQNFAFFLLFFVFTSVFLILPLIFASLFFFRGFFTIYYYLPIFTSFLTVIFFSYLYHREKNIFLKILILIVASFAIFLTLWMTFILVIVLSYVF